MESSNTRWLEIMQESNIFICMCMCVYLFVYMSACVCWCAFFRHLSGFWDCVKDKMIKLWGLCIINAVAEYKTGPLSGV